MQLFVPRDAFSGQAGKRTGEKCRESIGDSFDVTGTENDEQRMLPGKT